MIAKHPARNLPVTRRSYAGGMDFKLKQPTRRALLQAALVVGAAPLFNRHALAADVERFPLGIASGCPRPDSLVLWTRLVSDALPERVEVQWELAEDEAFTRMAARGTEQALAADAHSVHAEPRGLKPDRWYWYRFSALGGRSRAGRTRTAPAADAAVTSLRFAIASCQRYDHGRYAAWRDMAEQDLDLVLFLGDYIYEYATPKDSKAERRHDGGLCRTLEQYRQRYAQYKTDPALQAMHERAPWIHTWDDHEVSNDYAGDQSEDLDPNFHQRRAAATQAYWEHMPFPKAMRPLDTNIRIHERYDWGRLARIITIDDRQWRDAQPCPKPGRGGSATVALKDCPSLLDPKRTILGAAQERWLDQSWDASRPWNLLAQQTLMAGVNWQDPAEGSGSYWTDGWDGYMAARTRLLQDMATHKLSNTVVLGGDVHANYVADLRANPRDFDAPVLATEFCGTSISSHGMEQSRISAMRPFNPQYKYARSDERGYMRFHLQSGQLDAELRSVVSPWDAQSQMRISARFAVESGKPGAVAA